MQNYREYKREHLDCAWARSKGTFRQHFQGEIFGAVLLVAVVFLLSFSEGFTELAGPEQVMIAVWMLAATVIVLLCVFLLILIFQMLAVPYVKAKANEEEIRLLSAKLAIKILDEGQVCLDSAINSLNQILSTPELPITAKDQQEIASTRLNHSAYMEKFSELVMLSADPYMLWAAAKAIEAHGGMFSDLQRIDQLIEEKIILGEPISQKSSLLKPLSTLQQADKGAQEIRKIYNDIIQGGGAYSEIPEFKMEELRGMTDRTTNLARTNNR